LGLIEAVAVGGLVILPAADAGADQAYRFARPPAGERQLPVGPEDVAPVAVRREMFVRAAYRATTPRWSAVT